MAATYPIHEVARHTGLTSRTLRHYGDIGLLNPSRVGAGGIRYYDEAALLRLQRIVLLRELGLSLPEIARVLAGEKDARSALRVHLTYLRAEKERIAAMIRAVSATITHLEEGEPLMAEDMFKGFDHTHYKDEVIERWGEDAYRKSNDWYRALSPQSKEQFMADSRAIALDFADAYRRGVPADGPEAQEIAARHYRWVATAWGGTRPSAEAYTGLGEMYVADPRFTKTYDQHGEGTAVFVRDAVAAYAAANL